MKRWLLLLACAVFPAWAQPNAILLVAKPELADPNFRETVVLVTRAPDGSTLGVVLNRPGSMRLAELAPSWPGAERFTQPLYLGGPVMRQVVVALFVSESRPKAAAFHVLQRVYLSMHPANIEPLAGEPPTRVRLFAGFAGWAPRQLEAEIEADGWYLLRASEDLVFREDTSGLWAELLARARGAHASRDAMTTVAER
jgi:putative transcriptional regulator